MKGRKLTMIPGPMALDDRVMAELAQQVFSHRSARFKELFVYVLNGVATITGTKGRVVAVTGSGTAGCEFAVSNVVSEGDKVVCIVNGFFAERLSDIAKRYSKKVFDVVSEYGEGADLEGLKRVAKDADTIFCVSNETSTGVFSPIKEVSEIAKKVGALLVVDHVSGVGHQFKMDEWGIDATITSTHESFGAPPGLSFIAFSKRALEKAKINDKHGYYFDLELYDRPLVSYETPFTPDLMALLAARKSLEIIFDEGLDNYIRRHEVCAEAMRVGIRATGLRLFANPAVASNTVTAFWAEGFAEKLRDKMLKDYEIEIAPGKGKLKGNTLRIGHVGRVDYKDVVTTLTGLGLALSDLGFKVPIGAGVTAAEKIFLESGHYDRLGRA